MRHALGIGLLVAAFSAAASHAAAQCVTNPVVTSAADDGPGTLREAIADACPEGTISFELGSGPRTIGLFAGTLVLSKNLTIAGPGANLLTVERASFASAFRIFRIDPNKRVTLRGFTIAGGDATGPEPDGGGAIYNRGGVLTVDGVTMRGNTARNGGAIHSWSIEGEASLTLLNSTLHGNRAMSGSGGAIALSGGLSTRPSVIANSTISGNTVSGFGGGIILISTPLTSAFLTVTNSTITNNRTQSTGGAFDGGGLFVLGGVVTLRNTLIAGNSGRVSASSQVPSDVRGFVNGASANNLIGTSAGMIGVTHGVNGNIVGAPGSEVDPRLGPLADNGGPTLTHQLLAGSPALDAGSNTFASDAGLTTDQRGRPRLADGPDPFNTTDTVDIGAFEAQLSIETVPDQTTGEDIVRTMTIGVGDPDLITAVTATSSNPTLVPNSPANLAFTGSGGSRTLRVTPAPDLFGTTEITITVTSGAEQVSDTMKLTVFPRGDAPSATGATTNEDTQTTSGLVITRNPVDGPEVTHFIIGSVTNGTLFKNDGTTPLGPVSAITVAEGAAGLKFTPSPNLHGGGGFVISASTSASGGLASGSAIIVNIDVLSVPDTPSITNASAAPGMQTTSGLVVTRNPVDFVDVSHFKVTGITGGTLFQNNGTTPIANGQFITAAQGAAGLKFTLSGTATGHVTVQASLSASDAGLGGGTATADIVVNPRTITIGADAPSASLVRRLSSGGSLISGPTAEFVAFEGNSGVRVAEADLTNDGVPDIIAGTGFGVPSRVTVFDGATGAVVRDFDPGFGAGGVFVAAGDVDGDGAPDIITADNGGSTLVHVFSGASGAPVWTMALGGAFTGGVRVAAGDINGDGYADLIVGNGPGPASRVRVFNGSTRAEVQAFSPYGGFVGGVYVAAGDVNGDGLADVITGAGAGGGPHVRVFNGSTGAERFGFFAFDGAFTGGVRVAAGDVNGDGGAEILAAQGPGGNQVRAFNGATGAAIGSPMTGPSLNGAYVSTAVPVNRMVIDAPATNGMVGSDFRLRGWAFHEGLFGVGIDFIHVWAYPTDGAPPTFLGWATLGDPRPDIGATFGAQYDNAGYHLDVTGLAEGTYEIAAYARNSTTGIFDIVRRVRVQVVGPGAGVQVAVDGPPVRAALPTFRLSGWAVDAGSPRSDSGIEYIHVYAFPHAGGAPIFLGWGVLGDARPDVGAIFGPRAAQSGYHLDVSGLPDGVYTLAVYPKAFANPFFSPPATAIVTVTPDGGMR